MAVSFSLTDWAARWNIPASALYELAAGQIHTAGNLSRDVESESAIQSLIRLEASAKGVMLWRNNVGVLKDDKGRPVRYGLGNDSPAVNEVFKSADLIGLRPVLITPAHVGTVVGQLVSREVKNADWHWTGTPRELAQLQWATVVNAHGGDAAIVNREGSL